MKLSIIIPIYNVEPYITRCLDSIYNQPISDDIFEIICVNDGSIDGSSNIVRQYQQNHNNILLIEQNNQGVSVARNEGIKRANGEIILFVDPDDKIEDLALPKIIKDDEKGINADIVICNFLIKNRKEYKWDNLFQENQLYRSEYILNSGYLRGSVCGVCFNRNFILKHNIMFLPTIRNGEDTNFMLHAMYYTNRIRFSNINVYHVIGRTESASNLYSKDRIDRMIKSVRIISDFIDILDHKEGEKVVLNYMQYISFSNLVNDSLKTEDVNFRYLINSHICDVKKYKINPQVQFLKWKMQLLYFSFPLFYFLCWIKSHKTK